MNLPDGFADEYEAMRERYEWAAQLGESIDVHQAKLTVEQTREFLQRWAGKVGVPAVEAGLQQFAKSIDRIARYLDALFLEDLSDVIQARKDWVVAELIFQGIQATIKLRKVMPAHLQSEFETVLRDESGRAFDPTVEFRETEANANKREQQYRQAFVKLEVDWPERLSQEIRQRLDKADPADLNAWLAELQEKIAKTA